MAAARGDEPDSALFGHAAMAAAMSSAAHLQAMLDFEAALARAEAKAGVIPEAAARTIAGQCDAGRFDPAALAAEAGDAGNAAIPMVRALTVRVADADAEAGRFVHWGATSQDAIDTGLVLQLRRALELLETDLARLADACAALAEAHRGTVMAGRTWMQQALPVTFGLKAAGWLDAAERHRARLAELRPRLLVLQFGGAAGTLAALGDRGPAVAEALAAELSLAPPALPWHAQRDRVAEAGALAALIAGTCGKIARDVALMAQTEVAEAAEPAGAGRGGSSAMPQKRNPVLCAAILAAAARTPGLAATLMAALPQEHERALGGWQAEWGVLPELFTLAAGALDRAATLAEGLELDPARMRANLEAGGGLLMAEAVKMALAAHLGQREAHEVVQRACAEARARGTSLRDALKAEATVTAALSAAEIDAALRPEAYLGAAEAFIDRALAGRRR